MLATDGAYKTMTRLGLADWPTLHGASSQDLADLLQQCQNWEASDDPDGQKLPRAKRHDDKTLAVAEFSRIDQGGAARLKRPESRDMALPPWRHHS